MTTKTNKYIETAKEELNKSILNHLNIALTSLLVRKGEAERLKEELETHITEMDKCMTLVTEAYESNKFVKYSDIKEFVRKHFEVEEDLTVKSYSNHKVESMLKARL